MVRAVEVVWKSKEGGVSSLFFGSAPQPLQKSRGSYKTVRSLPGGVWIGSENGKEQNLEGYVKVCLKQSVQKGVPENGNTMCTSWSREQARQVKGLQWAHDLEPCVLEGSTWAQG